MVMEFQALRRIARFIQDKRGIRLQQAGECLVLREFPEFVVSHQYSFRIIPSPLRASESLTTLAFRRHFPASGSFSLPS